MKLLALILLITAILTFAATQMDFKTVSCYRKRLRMLEDCTKYFDYCEEKSDKTECNNIYAVCAHMAEKRYKKCVDGVDNV